MHPKLPVTATAAASVYSQDNIGHGPGYSIEGISRFLTTEYPIDPSRWYPAADPTLSSIRDIFRFTSVGIRFLLDQFDLPSDLCLAIAEGIKDGTCVAVCDGSFNKAVNCAGTAAFTIHATQIDEDPLTGGNWTTGPASDQCSYWSELGGIIGVLLAIDIVFRFYKIGSSKLTLKCGNETAVDQAGGDWPLRASQECFNYLQVVRNMLRELPIEVEIQWVKGHKKGKKSWWHQRNEFCNAKVKELLLFYWRPSGSQERASLSLASLGTLGTLP